jgi:hypothetical protein
LKTLEMTGVKEPRGEHTSCRARGDARCLFLMTWQAE